MTNPFPQTPDFSGHNAPSRRSAARPEGDGRGDMDLQRKGA